MSRRGKGEGLVRKRADGKWEARIEVGRDANGKRIRKSIYGATKKAVTDELTKLASAKLDGKLVADSKLSVSEFLDKWLADVVKLSNRPATHLSYSQNVRVHIKPAIGSHKLSKLGPVQVQEMYAKMERNKVSPRMRQMIHAILRRALRIAVKWGLVPRNVCDAVERPQAPKHEFTVLDVAKIQALMTAAEGERLHGYMVVSILSGLRQGELFGLEWSDIDLQAGCLNVRRTTVDIDGEVKTSPPKTGSGHRLVELPAKAVEALKGQKAMLEASGLKDCPLVFPDTFGGYQRRFGPFRAEFAAIVKKAGLSKVSPHSLRHANATLLLTAGTHPKIVQERLGHSNVGITMDTYSHVLPSMQKEAAGKLDAMFKTDSVG